MKKKPTTEVLFLRWHVDSGGVITMALRPYYDEGWRVVSHSESEREYSFVLERKADPR